MYFLTRVEGFYDSIDKKEEAFFFDYITTKKSGYKANYGKKTLPLDQYDFLSTFYVLYKRIDEKYVPFMVQRYLSKKKCEHFGLSFPILELAYRELKNKDRRPLDQFLESVGDNDIVYPSSFTIDPELKAWPSEKELISELTGMFHYLESKERQTNFFLTSSVKRFKTYRLLNLVGHHFLGEKGLKKEKFEGEEVLLMALSKLSDYCKQSYLKHEHLFNGSDVLEAG